MTKKSRQKLKYLENEKSFQEEACFIIFEELSLKQTIIIFFRRWKPDFNSHLLFLFYAKDYLAYKKKLAVTVPQYYLGRPIVKLVINLFKVYLCTSMNYCKVCTIVFEGGEIWR